MLKATNRRGQHLENPSGRRAVNEPDGGACCQQIEKLLNKVRDLIGLRNVTVAARVQRACSSTFHSERGEASHRAIEP